ncbi:MAG: response regulator transcription factor [Mycobacterium leprae]
MKHRLTTRERDIFRLLVHGWTNREIAAELGLTQDTAREYIARVYEKLDVHRRSSLISKALDLGLLEITVKM